MRLFSNTSDPSTAIPPELLCRPLRYLQNDLLENLPKKKKKTSCSSLQEASYLYVTRFELATFWSVARRSIQLSYTYTSLRSTCFATKITIPKFLTFVNAFSPFFRLSFKCYATGPGGVVRSGYTLVPCSDLAVLSSQNTLASTEASQGP